VQVGMNLIVVGSKEAKAAGGGDAPPSAG
jgi:hypothetical protein